MRSTSQNRTITHVVPTTLSGRCGVGDYAVRLAQGLNQLGYHSTFLGVGHEHFGAHRRESGNGGHILLDSNEPSVVLDATRELQPQTVIIHLSPFGYHPDAAPYWLLTFLKQLRRACPTNLITVFHEVWQPFSLLSRRLYKSFTQRRLLTEIAIQSDCYVTNTSARLSRLQKVASGVPGYALPVFSNVGEAEDFPEVKQDTAVVFGSAKQRALCWSSINKFADIVEKLPVVKFLDIGPGQVPIPISIRDRVEVKGLVSSSEVHELLSSAKVGLLHYRQSDLGKSGLLAAYASHGSSVVNLCKWERLSEGLAEEYFISATQWSEKRIQISRRDLWLWYQNHRLAKAAMFYAQLIGSMKYSMPS